MSMGVCPEHGKMLVRLKFHKADINQWSTTRMTYEATESMQSYYKTKAAHSRRRGRGRGKRRGKSAAAQNSANA
jgi:hypothetical protein